MFGGVAVVGATAELVLFRSKQERRRDRRIGALNKLHKLYISGQRPYPPRAPGWKGAAERP
jgi:hypothetical protein